MSYFIVNCFLNILVLIILGIVFKRISTLTKQFSLTPEELYQQVNIYNEESILREKLFDERISKIKDELAMQQTVSRASSGEAKELHPLVKNLPHSSYDMAQYFSGEEYAK